VATHLAQDSGGDNGPTLGERRRELKLQELLETHTGPQGYLLAAAGLRQSSPFPLPPRPAGKRGQTGDATTNRRSRLNRGEQAARLAANPFSPRLHGRPEKKAKKTKPAIARRRALAPEREYSRHHQIRTSPPPPSPSPHHHGQPEGVRRAGGPPPLGSSTQPQPYSAAWWPMDLQFAPARGDKSQSNRTLEPRSGRRDPEIHTRR
jgi:hypothetical protein